MALPCWPPSLLTLTPWAQPHPHPPSFSRDTAGCPWPSHPLALPGCTFPRPCFSCASRLPLLQAPERSVPCSLLASGVADSPWRSWLVEASLRSLPLSARVLPGAPAISLRESASASLLALETSHSGLRSTLMTSLLA